MLKYAAAAALAAILASKYTSQPPPYDDGAASIIKVDARLLAGNAHGAPFPPVYKGKWALNDRLTKATRLFEGQVEGSESVATLSDGTLLTVDKYGWVRTCVLNLRVVLHAIDGTRHRLISAQVWTAPRGARKPPRSGASGPGDLGVSRGRGQALRGLLAKRGVHALVCSMAWRWTQLLRHRRDAPTNAGSRAS